MMPLTEVQRQAIEAEDLHRETIYNQSCYKGDSGRVELLPPDESRPWS